MEEEVRVLLIEDDRASADMYCARLTADGYTVTVAGDGQEGLELAGRELPDLIYLDLRLPKKDGFEVLQQLRAGGPTAAIPVIILTNYGEPELRARGLELGALEFLVKSDTTPAALAEKTGRFTSASARPPVAS